MSSRTHNKQAINTEANKYELSTVHLFVHCGVLLVTHLAPTQHSRWIDHDNSRENAALGLNRLMEGNVGSVELCIIVT